MNASYTSGAALLLVMLLLLTGCSDRPTGPPHFETRGQVTFNRKPVSKALVVFMSEELRISRGARTDSDGRFRVVAASGVGLPAGDYKVLVRPAPGADEEMVNRNRSDIPLLFRSENTSGLTFTVGEEAPELEIELGSASS